MTADVGRRAALFGFGSAALGAGILSADAGHALAGESPISLGAGELRDFGVRLGKASRRRDFKTVPMVLDDPDLWDAAALDEVIAYRGAYKQVWDNTALGGPWLNLMRNSINAQMFSFRHPDFLAVSATHGTAHLALFDEPTWDKYRLANLAGKNLKANRLIIANPAASAPLDFEDPNGVFGPAGDTIPALQSRGVVFLACHNAIWELSAKLLRLGVNPDHLSHGGIAAELTNHLVEGAVLTPGMVATIPELQRAGFRYIA
jgi:hypothetical protein